LLLRGFFKEKGKASKRKSRSPFQFFLGRKKQKQKSFDNCLALSLSLLSTLRHVEVRPVACWMSLDLV